MKKVSGFSPRKVAGSSLLGKLLNGVFNHKGEHADTPRSSKFAGQNYALEQMEPRLLLSADSIVLSQAGVLTVDLDDYANHVQLEQHQHLNLEQLR